MPTSWGRGGALGLGLALGAAAGAWSAGGAGGPAPQPIAEHDPSDVILVEAFAEVGPSGRRVGPLRLRAAAAPVSAPEVDGCAVEGPLRGAPIASALRVELSAEVALPWRAEAGQHRAVIDEPERVWAELSWREAGIAADGWHQAAALRTEGPPALRAGAALLGDVDELRLILPGPTGPRRCRLSPEGLAAAAMGGASLERWVERSVVLPDGRQLHTRTRLRAPWAEDRPLRPIASGPDRPPTWAPARRDLRVIRRLPA